MLLDRSKDKELNPRPSQEFFGGMNERSQRLVADRARDVPLRIDGVDQDERLGERFRGAPIQLDSLPSPPISRGLEDAAERAVPEHEELAQVSREPLDFRLGPVDPDALAERLQEADLVALR